MLRAAIAIFSCAFLSPQFVVAAPIQLISGLPAAYVPGQAVTFDVRLPTTTNLGSYNLDLVLESSSGTAGVDFFFDVAATVPAPTNYVFPSSANFFDAVNVDSPTRNRITLTDFAFSGVNVASGVNDRVANVVLRTAATFNGNMTLSVDVGGLILDTPDVNSTPVPGFDALKSDIAAGGPIELTSVPEPATLTYCVLSVLFGSRIAARRRAL